MNNKMLMSAGKVGLKRAPVELLSHCNGGVLVQNKGTVNKVHPAKTSQGNDLGLVVSAESW